MKTTVATILSSAELAGVAILYFKVDRLADDVRVFAPAERAAPARTEAPARMLAPRRTDRIDSRRAALPIAETNGTTSDAAEPAASEGTVEERLAKLEAAETARKTRRMHGGPMSPVRFPRFARSVDQLATQLKLTATQKDRIKDSIRRGQRRVEEVMKIPDETGTSPFERRAERRRKINEAIKSGDHGSVMKLAHDWAAVYNRKIPGRDTTYGQEMKRVREETRSEVESSLTPTQREQFESTSIDGLVGGPGGQPVAVSVFRSSDHNGDGVFVSGGMTEIAVDVAGGAETSTEPSDSGEERGDATRDPAESDSPGSGG